MTLKRNINKLNIINIYQSSFTSLWYLLWPLLKKTGLICGISLFLNFYWLAYLKTTLIIDLTLYCFNIIIIAILSLQFHRAFSYEAVTPISLPHLLLCLINYITNSLMLIAIAISPFLIYLGIQLARQYSLIDNSIEFKLGELNWEYSGYYTVFIASYLISIRLILILPNIAINQKTELVSLWKISRGSVISFLGIITVPILLLTKAIDFFDLTYSKIIIFAQLFLIYLIFYFFLSCLTICYNRLKHL